MLNPNLVLITGAGKRIGKSIAITLAKAGWNVAVHYNHSKAEAEELVEELSALGVRCQSFRANLNDAEEVEKLMPAVNAAMGPVTCLINNASLFVNDPKSGITKENWDKHMAVNLWAPVALSQAFVKQLPASAKGNIINLLDYCVWNLPEGFTSYVISKSGLWTLTQIMAKQYAPQVRVNGIGPGHFLPAAQEPAEHFQKAVENTLLKTGGSVEEACRTVEFILSTPSFTGQMIALDGGKHLIGAEHY